MVNSFSTTNGLSKLVAQGQINLVQKENFALGRIEREIGFGPENDLAYMIKRSKILSVFDKKWGSNTTADYEVEATYVTSSSRSGPRRFKFLSLWTSHFFKNSDIPQVSLRI